MNPGAAVAGPRLATVSPVLRAPITCARGVIVLVTVALTAPGCSRTTEVSSTPPVSTFESVAPTVATIATTSPPTTTTTVVATTTTTTTVPPTTGPTTSVEQRLDPSQLTLTSSGISPFAFGDADDIVLRGMTLAFGSAVADEAQAYPIELDERWVDEPGENVYAHPLGRLVCFDSGLCLQFGGASAADLRLTGWVQRAGDRPLATGSGITVGSRWSDHVDAIDVDEGGCFSIGTGSTAGIGLVLQSAGEPFLIVDETTGEQTPNAPDPADVSVSELHAGVRPISVVDDC